MRYTDLIKEMNFHIRNKPKIPKWKKQKEYKLPKHFQKIVALLAVKNYLLELTKEE